jgi:3-oxoacyl-[acyl-carrier protein] reductase|tara:strand:+ start:3429 stop:4127 length:699 start_codon:yes stop_codon:yes gene_type:complete
MSQVAFITGTRKGIGRAIAEHLLSQGWIVGGCSRRSTDLVHENYHHFEIDVADEAAVIETIKTIKKLHGPIRALINNAGVASMNHILLTPVESYEKIFKTNVLGTFLVLRETAKQMSRNGGGRIINFSSIASPLNLEGEALYAASKSAVESLTKTAAKELASMDITVNAIGPTPVETDLIKLVPKEKIDALLEQQPIKRLGTQEDILNCVDFLLKPESDFITGQILYLGGVN